MTSSQDSKYDRQMRTFGKSASSKIANGVVYVFNLEGGLGTEICKNLVLSGINELHLVDENTVNKKDVEFGYFYSIEDFNSKRYRVDVLSKHLSEINSSTTITSHKIGDVDIKPNSTCVLVNMNSEEATKINDTVRKINCKTVYTISNGTAGFVFVDAVNHTVLDTNDNIYEPLQITNISNHGKVECTNHYLQEGDKVIFQNLEGIDLDFLDTYWIASNVKRNSFEIKHSEFKLFPKRDFVFRNGTCIYIKLPKEFNHNSLAKELSNPTIINDDKKLSFRIIDTLVSLKNPICSQFYTETKALFKTVGLELAPVNSIIGGIASTEVIKCVSEKYTPISQWMTYHDFDFIPDVAYNVNNDNFFSRYYGNELYDKIKNLRIGMVGCGALGCEWLKNLALMGACTNGNLDVTDPDHIELSNLSRQFLFRNKDINSSKSDVAKNKINEQYGSFNIKSHKQKLSDENDEFSQEFFSGKDLIINALDNTEARRYVDNLCFENNLALFESGTMGMKGNTQPVIPFVTETYSNSSDPVEEVQYPVCTIKNFPNKIHHTIHWARDKFEFFKEGPETVNKYIKDPTYLEGLSLIDKNKAIDYLNEFLYHHNCSSWEECTEWAVQMYLKEFNHNIVQLLHCFPENHLIDDKLFWSNGKKCPSPLNLNKNSYEFIYATTKVLCNCYNIKDNFTLEQVITIIKGIKTEQFVPKNMNIAKNDEELKSQKIQEEQKELLFSNLTFYHTLIPQYFEKDDDTNYHIKWITAASNNRALNYKIPEASEYETKGIAGKIIPAVATTTSTVVGLIAMELYKYLQANDNIEIYKSYFVNMSDNTLIPAEPIKATTIKVGDTTLNTWEKLKYTNNSTLEQLIEYYQNKFRINITMILVNSTILYANFMPTDKNCLLSDILNEKNISGKNTLIIASEEEIELPTIQLEL